MYRRVLSLVVDVVAVVLVVEGGGRVAINSRHLGGRDKSRTEVLSEPPCNVF